MGLFPQILDKSIQRDIHSFTIFKYFAKNREIFIIYPHMWILPFIVYIPHMWLYGMSTLHIPWNKLFSRARVHRKIKKMATIN